MKEYELIIIGGGVAGMSAAMGAKQNGVKDILILEREERLGGTVNLCIHNGFGKKVLGTKITGPEYVDYLKTDLKALNVECRLSTMVLRINHENVVTFVNPDDGMQKVKGKAIIIATGSREKYTGRVNIINSKITGVYAIGTAQQFVNIHGYLPGKDIVIVGSNEIALIIARRLIVEGARIKAIVEEEDEVICKSREIKSIIDTFNIPVITSSAITDLIGKERIEKIKVSGVNSQDDMYSNEIECDCVLVTVDLMPETDLLKNINVDMYTNGAPIVDDKMSTNRREIFACGNAVHSYGYADDTTIEGIQTGKNAAEYICKINTMMH
ncbi:MAG: NAD(P)/FAD-dependent oxidoreductase [Inconstantimicrobium porci]|uniref:NAD(P)/FAD-dependent oxidoreductase n=1 Tax=Inconstantimicrobium porci TaxID=2652291 RepID=A0A7X2MXK8_9CLOT|nr:NAD(P)/FAD-dependent oxidoreductase [Inconstantimicrobium porci]MDD6770824.1 NAD(P)/FAD-dependent oxidoreductase [Inconstantimicrobium porci]MDY5911042.1 NAD(P)/FAD-dependent oxidoreductase [Inconstantimicrobium porci]MSR90956.1 NAD(P)/FAD-dependent oxidoreductase [Inconstantimicrobium porci]